METPITELQCLERLSELAEIIERNNWQHLYDQVETLALHERKKLDKLEEQNSNLAEENAELKDAMQQIKIKSMAIADMRKGLMELIDASTSK
jgi:hypothetical protein